MLLDQSESTILHLMDGKWLDAMAKIVTERVLSLASFLHSAVRFTITRDVALHLRTFAQLEYWCDISSIDVMFFLRRKCTSLYQQDKYREKLLTVHFRQICRIVEIRRLVYRSRLHSTNTFFCLMVILIHSYRTHHQTSGFYNKMRSLYLIHTLIGSSLSAAEEENNGKWRMICESCLQCSTRFTVKAHLIKSNK